METIMMLYLITVVISTICITIYVCDNKRLKASKHLLPALCYAWIPGLNLMFAIKGVLTVLINYYYEKRRK